MYVCVGVVHSLTATHLLEIDGDEADIYHYMQLAADADNANAIYFMGTYFAAGNITCLMMRT
jgi:TPR repeat protein